MNIKRSASQRSEEARREAKSAMLRAKQAQNKLLKERAADLAVKTQKVDNLRALRLAKEAQDRISEIANDDAPRSVKPTTSKAPRAKPRAKAPVASGQTMLDKRKAADAME